MECRT
jgi:hypothetical protein